MKLEEAKFLQQLVEALEKGVEKLEDNFEKDNVDGLNKTKKFMIQVQKKITGAIK